MKLTWTNPTTNTDGSPLDPADIAGYEIQIDGVGAVAIPVSGAATEFDNAEQLPGIEALVAGNHTIAIDVVNKEGQPSTFSAAVTFSVAPKVPNAPSNLAVIP